MKRVWAVILSLALFSQASVLPVAAQTSTTPFSSLVPPARIASLGSTFGGRGAGSYPKSPDVLIIQDLHFNFAVQKNIGKLLAFLHERGVLGPRIAVEGAVGEVDNSLLAEVSNPKVREELASFLMQNGEITGSQYYSILSGQPKVLYGVEDPAYFQANRDIFRLSYGKRQIALAQVSDLQARLGTLVSTLSSKPVRRLQKARRLYVDGRLSFSKYWDVLQAEGDRAGVPLPARRTEDLNYQLIDDYALAVQEASARTTEEKNLIRLLHEFTLVEKALAQHTTLEEIRRVASRVDRLVGLVELLGTETRGMILLDTAELKEALRASVDFYVAALMRNDPMLENTLKLVTENRGRAPPQSGQSVALIVGGFHTAYLTEELQKKGLSYAVYTPYVDEHTPDDQALYEKRFMGERLTEKDAAIALISPSKRTSSFKLFNSAGLIPVAQRWWRGLADAASRGGGLVSQPVRAWAQRSAADAEVEARDADIGGNVIASTFAQALSHGWKKPANGRVKRLAFFIGRTVTMPYVMIHEYMGHVLAMRLFSRMLQRGEVRISSFRDVLRGRPLRGPAGSEDQLPYMPLWERWAGVAANLVVGYVVGEFARFLPQTYFLDSFTYWYLGFGNLVFVFAEFATELYLKRGEIYSLKYNYDKRYPSLLSIEEGRRQLNAAADNYLNDSKEGDLDSPVVAIVRLDPPFQQIVEERIGSDLSRVVRNQIYSVFVAEVRRKIPGALIAATEDEYQLLVILPPHFNRNKTWEPVIGGIIERLYRTPFMSGYQIADLPNIKEVKESAEKQGRGVWRQVVDSLGRHGIHIAPYAGGVALIQNIELPEGESAMATLEVRDRIRRAAEEINSVTGSNLGEELQANLNDGVSHHASYPLTMSIMGLPLRRADVLLAWSRHPQRMAQTQNNPDEVLTTARALLDAESQTAAIVRGRVNLARRNATLGQAELVLQSMMVEIQDRINTTVTTGIVRDGREIEIYSSDIRRIGTRNHRRKDVKTTMLLLEESLEGQDQPLKPYGLKHNAQRQKAAQQRAELALQDYSARVSPDSGYETEAMRAHWLQATRIYRESFEGAPRTPFMYLSAWKSDQADWFEDNIDQTIYPEGTRIHALANPVAPPSLRPLGRADGNGMAVLGVMRKFILDLVQRRNLQPGRYNLYDVMGHEMFGTDFGAGQATRNPVSTQRGKFNLFTFMERFVHRLPDGTGLPATLEEALAVMKALLEKTFPQTHEGRPLGGYILLYGDAFITVDPKVLVDHFAKTDVSEGFTLLLRRVPYEEAMDWGCAATDSHSGKILTFEEKPGLAILSKPEQGILRDFLNGASSEVLEAKAKEAGLEGFEQIRKKLHDGLARKGLLVDEKYILMNTAIGVAGTGTVIRLLQMAGAQISEDGSFEVHESGQAPMAPENLSGLISLVQEELSFLLSDVGTVHKNDLAHSIALTTGRIGEDLRRVAPDTRAIIVDILDRIKVRGSKEDAVDSIRTAMAELGEKISVLDGLLRDGMPLDAMADLVNKMASEANLRPLFEAAANRLTPPDPVSLERESRRLAIYSAAQDKIKSWQARIQGNDPDLEGVIAELHEALSVIRPVLLRTRTDGLASDEARANGPIYYSYAMLLWGLRIWQHLHSPDGAQGSGRLYGAEFDGAWLDTGATTNVLEYYLRTTKLGKALSAIFAFTPLLFSATPPMHAVQSVSVEARNKLDPQALLVGSHLGGLHPRMDVDSRTMEEHSALFFAHVPWPFHLYKDSVGVEGVVQGSDGHTYVTHAIWTGEAQPGKSDLHFGESMKAWLQGQSVDTSEVWPVDSTLGKARPNVLFEAKVFPGVSEKLLEKSRATESMDELRAAAQDPLDWEIFEAMPEIWEWLQHKANAPPAAWIKALDAGRLYSFSDQYTRGDPHKYKSRQRMTLNALASVMRTNQPSAYTTTYTPVVNSAYWITGLPIAPSSIEEDEDAEGDGGISAAEQGSKSWGEEGGALRATEAHSFMAIMAGILGIGVLLNLAPLVLMALPWFLAAVGQEVAVISTAFASGRIKEALVSSTPIAWYDFNTQTEDLRQTSVFGRTFAHAHELGRAMTQSPNAVAPRVVAPLTLALAVLDDLVAGILDLIGAILPAEPVPDQAMALALSRQSEPIRNLLGPAQALAMPTASALWNRLWKNSHARRAAAELAARHALSAAA